MALAQAPRRACGKPHEANGGEVQEGTSLIGTKRDICTQDDAAHARLPFHAGGVGLWSLAHREAEAGVANRRFVKMSGVVHFDITEILEYARHNATLSGIQRVTTEIITHIVNRHGTDKLRLIGWHPLRHRIVSFDASYFSGNYKYDQEDFCRHFGVARPPIGGASLKFYLDRKYGRRSWRRPVHHARLLLANGLTAGRTFRKRNIGPAGARQPPRGRMTDGLPLEPGDLVFIPGATWNFDDYLSALAQERQRRVVTVCHLIHDLIPLLAPEHVGDGVPERFARWLAHLSRNTDYFLTNSYATQRDLEAWMAENCAAVPTGVLPLAHQFVDHPQRSLRAADIDGGIQARVRNAARLPYVLCVGTIESRKNIWTLANVWKRIYERLGCNTPRLIFAGRQGGGLNEDFEDFIRGTGSVYGYIRVLECPNDAELAFLYRRCLSRSIRATRRAGVCPSARACGSDAPSSPRTQAPCLRLADGSPTMSTRCRGSRSKPPSSN
jgi:glycosyltransferase involved in cell wall biosynthesis